MYKKFNKKTQNYMDKTKWDQGKPEGNEGSVNDFLSTKALKGLPHSTVSLTVDPYTNSLPTSTPYALINKNNKVIGGRYAGDKNLDGGNVAQYSSSATSGMLKYFDYFRLKLKFNYRYINFTPLTSPEYEYDAETEADATTRTEVSHYAGRQLIDEMRRSIAEAVSVLKSTTFTQMAIYDYAIVTDMPMGSATATKMTIDSQDVWVYTDLTDVIFASLIYYQLTLQDLLTVFNINNSFRLKMGTMIRNAWNREVSILQSLFGLFKKAAYLSLLDSFALSFEGEYIDREFMVQTNQLLLTPSRKSNDMMDPLLEIQGHFTKPTKFKLILKASDDTYAGTQFDAEKDFKDASGNTLDSTVETIQDTLSAEDTAAWARSNSVSAVADRARFNAVDNAMTTLNKFITIFKSKWSDVREVLDTLSRVGVVNWTKMNRFTVTKDTDACLFRNLIVDDIYKIVASSAPSVDYDENTKRWRTYSLWNMYDGIPEYDTYQGGAFLTLSGKTRNISTDYDHTVDYLPVAFEKADAMIYTTSRDAVRVKIDTSATVTMSTDAVFARLVPLSSQSALTIKVPRVTSAYEGTLTTGHKSCIYKQLLSVFGVAGVRLANTGSSYDYGIDPDIIAVYQIELSDITNEAITYARLNGPIRGTVSQPSVLGFLGTKRA